MTDAEAYAEFTRQLNEVATFKRRPQDCDGNLYPAFKRVQARQAAERRAERDARLAALGPSKWATMTDEQREEARERYGR